MERVGLGGWVIWWRRG